MIETTILVSVLFSIAALALRPGALVGILVASILIYPEYLRIPIGVSEMSAPRIVAIVGLLRMIAIGRASSLRLDWPDALICLTYLWSVLAQLFAGTPFEQLATHVGRFFDTVLMYFVARLAITNIDDLKDSAWILALSGIIVGTLGAIQSATQYSPYASMEKFRGWVWVEKAPEFRMGFLRAQLSTSHSIYFGLAMLALTVLNWGASRLIRPPLLGLVAIFFSLLGVASSVSSGPLAGLIIFSVFLSFESRRKWIKPALWVVVIICILAEFISNRHFYYLLDRLTFSGHTSWYRGKLLEVGLSRWYEYWLVGVGPNMPHHWGRLVDGRKHVDIVNHYLLLAVYGGFLYPALYLSCHAMVIRNVIRAFKYPLSPIQTRLLFALSAGILALDIAGFSVGLLGPVMVISYLTLGVLNSATHAVMLERSLADDSMNPEFRQNDSRPPQLDGSANEHFSLNY